MNRRDEMLAERAELIAANEAATSWGAAVGARSERIKEINRHLAAMDAEEKRLSQAEPGYVAGFEACRAALIHVRSIIAEAAMVGFNWKDGDWADRLFASQQRTSAAIAALPAPATASAGEEVTVEELALAIGNCDRRMWGFKNAEAPEGPHWDNSLTKARALLSTYTITKRSAT